MNCEYCGSYVKSKKKNCPHCGAPIIIRLREINECPSLPPPLRLNEPPRGTQIGDRELVPVILCIIWILFWVGIWGFCFTVSLRVFIASIITGLLFMMPAIFYLFEGYQETIP